MTDFDAALGPGLEDDDARAREGKADLVRLFETPRRLLEAIVAAEVLGPPLALRAGTTPFDRRTF